MERANAAPPLTPADMGEPTAGPEVRQEKIFTQVQQPKQLYFVPGAGHNDCFAGNKEPHCKGAV